MSNNKVFYRKTLPNGISFLLWARPGQAVPADWNRIPRVEAVRTCTDARQRMKQGRPHGDVYIVPIDARTCGREILAVDAPYCKYIVEMQDIYFAEKGLI